MPQQNLLAAKPFKNSLNLNRLEPTGTGHEQVYFAASSTLAAPVRRECSKVCPLPIHVFHKQVKPQSAPTNFCNCLRGVKSCAKEGRLFGSLQEEQVPEKYLLTPAMTH